MNPFWEACKEADDFLLFEQTSLNPSESAIKARAKKAVRQRVSVDEIIYEQFRLWRAKHAMLARVRVGVPFNGSVACDVPSEQPGEQPIIQDNKRVVDHGDIVEEFDIGA